VTIKNADGVSIVAPGFYTKPIPVRCDQWFKNGDHPEDGVGKPRTDPASGETYDGIEGAVVGFFRNPDFPGASTCQHCVRTMHDHGWIETLEGGHIVCPGDVIITGIRGERYPCKVDIFQESYEGAALDV